jgi:transcriptional regulator with GAF, ATPase, and Fis domain
MYERLGGFMRDLPSRATFAALTRAATEVVPCPALGFARSLDDGRVSVLHADGHGIGLITSDHLALTVAPAPTSSANLPTPPLRDAAPAPTRPSSATDLQSMERAMIDEALQRARFNKSKAAKALGLTRQQLYVRMRKYGLD